MIDGVILDEFESMLDAKTGKSRSGTSITTGTVSRIDNDGSVWVRLAGASVDTPCRTTTVAVNPGDSVSVEVGGGSARVTGNISDPSAPSSRVYTVEVAVEGASRSAGAAMSASVAAEQAAREAEAVATATGQHFWYDEDGAHVTDVTQDEWNDSTGEHYHSGFNSLFNSLGMLLRRALNNLASFTRGSVAFYDGDGNSDSNITAMFGKDGAQVGAVGNPRILITSDSLSGVNADDVAFFDIDYDGAVITGPVRKKVNDSSHGGMFTHGRFMKTVRLPSNVVPGSPICFPPTPDLSCAVLPYRSLVDIVSTTNCLAELTNNNSVVKVYLLPEEFTEGTSASYEAEVVVDRGSGLSNWTISFTIEYDSDSNVVNGEISSSAVGQEQTCAWASGGVIEWIVPTTAPAFTFGSRAPSAGIGGYSTVVGESLGAPESGQFMLGRFNDYESNADSGMLFSIGCGTADDDRANVIEVFDDSVVNEGFRVYANSYYSGTVHADGHVSSSGNVSGATLSSDGGLYLYGGTALENCFSTVQVSAAIGAVASGADKQLTISASRTGYKPIAISGFYLSGAAKLSVYMCRLNGTNAQIFVHNGSSTAQATGATAYVQVLYIKTSDGGDAIPAYTGDYTVTPRVYEQTLDTDGKRMLDDVTVEVIPVARVSNEQGGETATIGE